MNLHISLHLDRHDFHCVSSYFQESHCDTDVDWVIFPWTTKGGASEQENMANGTTQWNDFMHVSEMWRVSQEIRQEGY